MKKNLMLSLLALAGVMGGKMAQAQSELSLTKTAPASVVAGGPLTYTLTLTNNGPNAATNVTVSDPLPAGTTFVSASQDGLISMPYTLPTVGQNGTVSASIASFPAPAPVSSSSYTAAAGSTIFFNGAGGLWKTDGTIAGTKLVKAGITLYNFKSSYNINSGAAIGNTLYFCGSDGTGDYELWKSDGTTAGTVRVKDIDPAGSSNPSYLTALGGVVYFTANDGINGEELWKSDGTAAGTTLLKDINPGGGNSGPAYLTALGGTLYFRASDGINGSELWKSDGTAAGTTLLKDIDPGASSSSPEYFAVMSGALYFRASSGLWKSDGTAVGTVQVKSGFFFYSMAAAGNTLFFHASDSSAGEELWKSDGTSAGTVRLKDINPGTGHSSPRNFTAIGSTLYFTAFDATNGQELWKSDGTAAGTVLVKDIYAGSNSSSPQYLTAAGGTLYFSAYDSNSNNILWQSDGTASGTFALRAPRTQTFNITVQAQGNAGDSLSNTATVTSDNDSRGDNNSATVTSTLTAAPASEVGLTKTAPGSVTAGQTLTYTLTAKTIGENGSPSYNVVLTDPLPAGTTFVSASQTGGTGAILTKPIVGQNGTVTARIPSLSALANIGYINDIENWNGVAYFSASNGLWKSDGTASGTVLIKYGINPTAMTVVGNTLYFKATDSVTGEELWKSDGTEAGTVRVKDIRPGTNGASIQNFTAVGNTLYFTASDGTSGTELWQSDGTEAGTKLVKDINPGAGNSSPLNLTALNGVLYFSASDGTTGTEFWKSDGTEAGTTIVKDINPGAGNSSPQYFCALNGVLYFNANDGTNGSELWKSDGTEGGTALVKDIRPGTDQSYPSSLVSVGNTLYFAAYNGRFYAGLWKSDGTDAGTVLVKDSVIESTIVNVAGSLYFFSSDMLWKSDGTTGGTVLLKSVGDFSSPTVVGNTLYFLGQDSPHGRELWKSDGTSAGTMLVKDIYPGSSSVTLQSPTAIGNTLYFGASEDFTNYGLWTSDGTESGTIPVRGLGSATFSIVVNVGSTVRGTLTNTATITSNNDSDDANNRATAVTTVTAPPSNNLKVVKTAPTTSKSGQNLTYTITAQNLNDAPAYDVVLSDALPVGTTFVSATQKAGPPFSLTTPAVGENGTVTAQIAKLERLISVLNPQNFVNVNGTLYFSASNGASGQELWKSDGTETGTVMVKDIRPGSGDSSPQNLTAVGNTLYFRATDDTSGQELWKSDGTAAGTVLVKDIRSGATSSSPSSFAALGGVLYFNANDGTSGSELWKSDGTEAGTVLVKDIYAGSNSSSPAYLTVMNGTLYFNAADSTNGGELWQSDGTAAGTVLVKDIYPGSSYSSPQYLTVIGNTLYFSAYSSSIGTELWKSDGTAAGTVLVKDIYAGFDYSFPQYLTAFNGTLYFAATNANNGTELWKSDGTEAGTVMVKDLVAGSDSSTPRALTTIGNTLYFGAADGFLGQELWKSDGTAAGTMLVKDINPGVNASNPFYLFNFGGTLLFGATDGTTATELWKSDGSEAGTVPMRLPQVATFEVVVNVSNTVGAKLSNTATIESSNADSDGSNNSSKADTTISLPPTALSLSRDEVQEKMPVGTFVGGFSSIDPNAGESFTYSLVTGDGDSDNDQFAIDRANLRTNDVFDAAVKSSYSIRVRTTDRDGLWFEQAFTIRVVETTKPVVTISSPTTNQKVLLSALTGDVLSGSATDNVGVVAVKARLSRKVGTANEYWNGTSFGATQAWLSATVHTVTVDTVGGPNVTWTLDGQLPPADKLVVGAYALQVYALDAANNKSAYANGTFNVVSDMVAPTLSINTPTTSQKLLISDFTGSAVGGSVNDDLGVASVKVRLSRKRGTANQYWNGSEFVSTSAYVDATVAGTSWSLGAATPTAEKLDNGAYLVEAYALDNGGNKSATAKVSFSLNTDYSAPSVSISTPTASKVIKIGEFGAGVITGTAADNIGVASVKLKLQRKRGTGYEYWNGTAFTPTSVLFDATYNSESGRWSYDSAIPASALDAGGYTVYATAFDGAGNKTTSASRAFSIIGTAGATGAVSVADKSAGSS